MLANQRSALFTSHSKAAVDGTQAPLMAFFLFKFKIPSQAWIRTGLDWFLTWSLSGSAPVSPDHELGGCRRGSSSSAEPCFFLASSDDHHACVLPFTEAWARMCLPGADPTSRQSPQPQRANVPFLHGPPVLPPLCELSTPLLPGSCQAEKGWRQETLLHPVPDPKQSMCMGSFPLRPPEFPSDFT